MTNKGKHQALIDGYSVEPTHIEQLFLEAAKDRISELEREQWFGDNEKRNRYRVDFLIKSKRVAIELDGRGTHFTKEQRENDAKRQRYLGLAEKAIRWQAQGKEKKQTSWEAR